jgi:uncharacterized protein
VAHSTINGAGIGFRRDFFDDLISTSGTLPRFVEFAPENYIGVGGIRGRELRQIVEKYPILCHGLSLSIGSPEPLDYQFLADLKHFLDQWPVQLYSEHLSYSKCDNAHLYDLLPIPFKEEAIDHVVGRILEVQDFLGRRIALENVSYYSSVAPEMEESTFLTEVVTRADCLMLLDINNVYVNSFNHGYDAHTFLENIPLDRVAYIHMAGHYQESEDLIIDSHGAPIIDPVYDLLAHALPKIAPCPILLERDHNIPPYAELLAELEQLQQIADESWQVVHA